VLKLLPDRAAGVDEQRNIAWTRLFALHGAARTLAWNPELATQLQRYAGFDPPASD
jgi:hypothetical protein